MIVKGQKRSVQSLSIQINRHCFLRCPYYIFFITLTTKERKQIDSIESKQPMYCNGKEECTSLPKQPQSLPSKMTGRQLGRSPMEKRRMSWKDCASRICIMPELSHDQTWSSPERMRPGQEDHSNDQGDEKTKVKNTENNKEFPQTIKASDHRSIRQRLLRRGGKAILAFAASIPQ